MRDAVGGDRWCASYRSWLIAGATSLVWLAQSGPAGAIDTFFPTFGNQGIDVRHYAVKLEVDPKSHSVDGQAILQITATRKLETFSLDLSRLKASSVKIDGVTARWRQEPGKLIVLPAKAIAKGQRFALQVVYGGFPKPIPDPTVDGSDAPGLGWTNWRATSYVVSEPVGAGTWYPVNDEPTDKAGYRFTITVSKPYVAVANGVPLSVTDLGAKRRNSSGSRSSPWRAISRSPTSTSIRWISGIPRAGCQSAASLTKATPGRYDCSAATNTGDDGFHREGGRPLSVRCLRRGDG